MLYSVIKYCDPTKYIICDSIENIMRQISPFWHFIGYLFVFVKAWDLTLKDLAFEKMGIWDLAEKF